MKLAERRTVMMITLMAMTEANAARRGSMLKAAMKSVPKVREGTTRRGGMFNAKRIPDITVGVT